MAAAGNGNGNNNDKNTGLMRRMGSKTGRYDPEPPDQWLFELRRSKCQTTRALAWIKSKTTAMSRSPFCVDENGMTLRGEHLAADLGWAIQTARNVLNELEEEGRARVDEEGRIWLCADIPAAHAALNSDHDIPVRNSVQSCFSGYLLDSVRQLPADIREKAEAKYAAFLEFRKAVEAEVMAQARAITDPIEDSTLSEFGLKKKRCKEKPEDPAETRPKLKLELLTEFNFVQSCEPDFVQTAENGLYKAEEGSVQSKSGGASLFTSDTDTDSSSSGASSTRKKSTTTTVSPDEPGRKKTPDPTRLAEFTEVVEATFAGTGRGVPKPGQSADAFAAFPADAAISDFGPYLAARIPRLKHAGGLKSVVEEFRTEWQRLAPAATAPRERSRPAPSEPTLEERIEELQGRIESRQRLANDKGRTPAQREEFRQQLLQAKAEKAQLEELLGKQTAKAAGD